VFTKMAFSPNKLKKAIYTKLTNDATLTALLSTVTSVYDNQAPSNAGYPFIVYSLISTVDQSNFTHWLNETLIQIDVYAKDQFPPGCYTAGDIAEEVCRVMDLASLTITDYNRVSCYRDLIQEFTEPEIEAHRVMLQYRVRISKAR